MPRLETIVLRNDKPERRLMDRMRDAVRSYWNGPFHSSDADAWSRWLSSSPPSSAGIVVDDAAAFRCAAFLGGVTKMASRMAAMPLFEFEKLPGGGSQRRESRISDLLHDAPNPWTTAYVFKQSFWINALVAGQAFAEIVFDASGQPAELWNLVPERVTPFYEGRELKYRIDGHAVLPASRILHVPGTSWNGVVGMDTVSMARDAIGLALQAQTFGARYFAQGATMGGVISGDLTDAARANLRTALEKRHAGAAQAHQVLMLPSGATYTPIGTDPRASQLLELREFQVREIARILDIPASELGASEASSLTYANVESRAIAFVQSLRPRLIAFEQECSKKLIPKSERRRRHVEHVLDAELRADSVGRAAVYTAALGRWMTSNEIRRLEGLPALPGGDTLQALSTPTDPSRTVSAFAHRDLLKDCLGRLETVTTDRALRCTTPEKLTDLAMRWHDDPLHRSGVADKLRSSIKAWLSASGREHEADALCAAIADHYVTATYTSLRAVAKQYGAGFEPALHAQVAQWRSGRRVEDLVDRLIAGKPLTEIAR